MRSAFTLLVALSSLPASAEDDLAPMSDRVFFSLSAGASQASARSFVDVTGVEHRALVAPYGWKASWAVGIWFTDWVGLELSTGAMSLGLGGGTPAAPITASGLGIQVVPSVRLALPLRYVAPYAGAGFAVFYPFVFEQRGEQAWKGSPGVQFGPRFFGGANVYLARDVRLFFEAEVLLFDATAAMTAKGGLSSTQQYRGMVVPSLSVGFALTPDAYKASPSKALWVLGALVPAMLAGVLGFVALPEGPK